MRRDETRAEGAMWREFGLRQALANMPSDSPGREVIKRLLERGRLTAEEARRFKAAGLRTALANMPPDSPGRVAVENLLAEIPTESADERRSGSATTSRASSATDERPSGPPTTARSSAASDLPEQLERLAQLHRRGDLTDAEFEAGRRKLLG